jgi:hypothetical protein
MDREEFERRLQAAARGEASDKPTKLDASLRALVEQLRGGPPAPSSGRHRVVRGDPPRRDSKR